MAALSALAAASDAEAANLRILQLENRLQRERTARLQAEAIAEKGLRELYEKQCALELIGDIATRANQDRAVEDTLSHTVVAICKHTGWAFGNVYMLARLGEHRLQPTSIWHAADPDRLASFIELTQASEFRPGRGLPGRVLADGQAVWIRDVTTDPNFPRASAAEGCGLRSAFAFPVLVGNEVLAVMEFFHREALDPDEALLEVMTQIGTQVGRVMERKRAEEQLIHDASHDVLTGLPNRLLFTDRLDRAIAAHRRRPEYLYAVLFIDLDRFKLVNDSLGHAAGDILLTTIAERMRAVITALPDERVIATLARLGGDEFTVLLEDLERSDISLEIAERLQTEINRPVEIDGQTVYCSASIGIAACEGGYETPNDILRDADLAMYRAKSSGSARSEIFDPSRHAIARDRLALESDLRAAVARNEFELHFQPIVDLKDGSLAGFEALVRWNRNGRPVPPCEFIPVAEETGLIARLGGWVLEEACKTLAHWQQRFQRSEPLTMSVNVSPKQFLRGSFVAEVAGAIEAAGIAPSALRLEITESVTIGDAETTIKILQELRDLGVRVSIDDFGTGYSSLSYLHQLPFDTLKIDKSFVMGMSEEKNGHQIIRTILDMARNLNMEVVAEGAETAFQAQQLSEMGCGFAQGYYFSHPLPRKDVEAMLADFR